MPRTWQAVSSVVPSIPLELLHAPCCPQNRIYTTWPAAPPPSLAGLCFFAYLCMGTLRAQQQAKA